MHSSLAPGSLTRAEYIAALRSDGERFAAAASEPLDTRVPSCPEWDLRALLLHTGEVHRFWTIVLTTPLTTYEEVKAAPEPPGLEPGDDLGVWVRDGIESLVAGIEASDPAQPMWSWSPYQSASFVPRRMAHETSVHRWDAEDATGDGRPIEPAALARDGVDEFFDTFLVAQQAQVGAGRAEALGGAGETLHLHETGGDGEWVVTLRDQGVEVEHGHTKADVAVRASASDFVLLLWGRIPVDGLDIFGDRGVIDRFLAWTDRS